MQQSSEPRYPSDEQVEALSEAVLILTDQVRALRHSVDEIEQELGWAIRAKVLDRLPRPEHPCDERFELPALDDSAIDIEHVCDPDDELTTVRDSPPPAPAARRNQAKLW